MKWLSRLFRRTETTQKTTADRPFAIQRPTIGFLNLQDDAGAPLLENDSRELSPLFGNSLTSTSDVPQCAVLFVYCDVEATGKIRGTTQSLRGIFKKAGAYIAVVASENDPDSLMNAIDDDTGWPSNIVLIIDRKGDICTTFFHRLFQMMGSGTTMLMAWVELAPQIPDYDNPNVPGSLMLAEAGHLTFAHGG